ncbi:TLC domain-containing protein 2-like isoform X3 [Ruditapes philippinarum]|uniref:TLC domain-containing protein 2-like isoform X3 n=1 Tax=Ruditapes philippinarum TaxID=129788 RepID=UPI00295B2E2A|nr:TLC domain-containing protein 2-like isoform X3 [Ruditapes philippinarum]
MTEKEFIFDPHNKVERSYGYCMFFVSIISFILTNIVVTKIGPPKNVKGDPWRWNNLFISWIHAAICGTWDILCLYFYPEMLDDLVHHINYFTYLMIAFSTGYFVYDFLDLMYNGKLIANWEVTLHHIAISFMGWYHLQMKMCIAYNLIAFLAEVNSIFLHSRKLLRGLGHDTIYHTVLLLNIFTFVVFRFIPNTRVLYGLFTDYHLGPKLYFQCLCAASVVLTTVNIGLFLRLASTDYKYYKSLTSKKKSLEKQAVNGNNNKVE